MRTLLIASLLLGSVTSAQAQVSVGFDIGINIPVYPELVPVPGYPVYYDPRGSTNYFFYDGAYWVYQGDSWYVSSWYNGPWQFVRPERVPLYVLRVPVRYYSRPPPYFRGWRDDAPPRWGEHWGRGWERHHPGWDRWDRRSAPRPAPLPVYQRQYAGDRYPRAPEQQYSIRSEQYRYRPREVVTRQRFEERGGRGGPREERGGPGGPREWRGGQREERGGPGGPREGRGGPGGPREDPRWQGSRAQERPSAQPQGDGRRGQPAPQQGRGPDRGREHERDERGSDRR